MNVNNLCEDCIYRYNCPVNGHKGACVPIRKTLSDFKKELKELNKGGK